jgi:hypothetical protein
MKTSRTTVPLYEQDREAIRAIRAYYGVRSDADAIRIALRETQRRIVSEGSPGAPAPDKDSPLIPQTFGRGVLGSEG